MRIAIFDPYLDTMSGGEKYMLSLALCLSKKHTVTLFWDKAKKKDIITKAEERFGFDLSILSFVPSIFDSTVSLLERYQTSKNYDLIILLSDGSIPLVKCPLILHIQSPMNWVNGRSLKNRLKLSRVKKIIVNSAYTKHFVDRIFAKQSIILYPPVSIRGKYDPLKKKQTILNVGRFGINQAGSSFKKQDVLADTFVTMYKAGLKNWHLVFVMSLFERDADTFNAFKDKYSAYPIEFIVNPNNDDLWDQYEKASIYWHASGYSEDLTLHPDRAEHFGISTVEAMGVGAVPVVVGVGGQKEIVEDQRNGRLWSNVEELAEFTGELIADEKKLRELAENAVTDAKKFSEDRFCQEVEELVS